MNDDQFMKLFKYVQGMNERLGRIEEMMATKDDVNQILSTLDGYASKIDDYALEMAAMQHKIDRLERMIDFLAKKVGVTRAQLEAHSGLK